MQVTHENNHVTHAVIGGGQTIDFGISSSAEFFNILSSTLYKDQILAVVREVLCNANDAHIEAGCTDTPIQVTLTEDKLTIRDFGTGIHLNDMGQIYGTYGNSTKKNDGEQTGGFGLGCKAPFAYTDHFEVVSMNDGIKTIYNLSKSSAQAQGKPGIVPIVSFPTEESGLEVSIVIKNYSDYSKFNKLIHRIASNGDMNVVLNGKPVVKLGFDNNKSNYLITINTDMLDNPTRIMLRYGNVIYPVDNSNEIKEDYFAVARHLDNLGRGLGYTQRIIFQAIPHSISVTPSRESLSMQEHTIKSIKKLLRDFMEMIHKDLTPECNKYAEEVVIKAVAEAKVSELLKRESQLPLVSGQDITGYVGNISDLNYMARRYMQSNYPNETSFRIKDITHRLKSMVNAGLLNRGMVQTYLRAMNNDITWNPLAGHDWLSRKYIGPIMKRMLAAGIDHKRLYVYDGQDQNTPNDWGRKNLQPIVSATNASPRNLLYCLPYLRNIVVVSTTRADIMDRAHRTQVMRDFGATDGFLFYQASMKKGAREAALAFFKASNMEVVDLVVAHVPRVTNPNAVKKVAKKGLVRLDSVIKSGRVNLYGGRTEDAVRIEEPEFVIHIPVTKSTNTSYLPNWDSSSSKVIIELFGDKGAIANTELIYQKWIDKGIKPFNQYIEEKICSYVINSKNIREYQSFDQNRAHLDYKFNTNLLNVIFQMKELRELFGITDNRTTTDKEYFKLWERLNDNRYNRTEVLRFTSSYFERIKVSKTIKDLVFKFKNPMVNLINYSALQTILRSEVEEVRQQAIDLVIAILNKKEFK